MADILARSGVITSTVKPSLVTGRWRNYACFTDMFSRFMVPLVRRMARKRLGKDIAPLNTMATHPDVLLGYARYNQTLNKTSLLLAKLKLLSQVHAAKLVECPF